MSAYASSPNIGTTEGATNTSSLLHRGTHSINAGPHVNSTAGSPQTAPLDTRSPSVVNYAPPSPRRSGVDDLKLEMYAPPSFEQRDRSPEARAARRRVMLRAVLGEFVGTMLFLFSVGAGVVNTHRVGMDPAMGTLSNAFIPSLMLVALAYSFCDISGAHFNPAVTFATWLSGKTSNRKSALFVVSQILGGICAMCLVMLCFPNASESMRLLTLTPAAGVEDGRVFFVEFMLTFLLVFVIFTVAFESVEDRKRQIQKVKGSFNSRGLTLYTANATSKTGLAPLIIGLCVFSLSMFGGSISGGAFNPVRVFAPAVFSGDFSRQYLYWFGELLGGALAALVSHGFHAYGVPQSIEKPTKKSLVEDARLAAATGQATNSTAAAAPGSPNANAATNAAANAAAFNSMGSVL